MSQSSQRISPGIRKLLISEVLIAALLCGGFMWSKYLSAQKPQVQQKEIPTAKLPVDVFRLQEHDFQEIFTGFGTARADREVIVAAQVPGEIIDIHPELKVGQRVSAGQFVPPGDGPSAQRDADMLVRLDARDLLQRRKQAETRIKEADAEIERLKLLRETTTRQVAQANKIFETLSSDLKLVERLRARDVGSETELNRARLELQRYEDNKIQLENQLASLPSQITAAEQRREAALSDRDQADNDIKRAEIIPPFSGILSEVFVEQGQYLRPGDRVVRLTDPEIVEIPISLGFEDFVQLVDLLKLQETENGRPAVTLAENETSAERWQGVLQRASPIADSRSRTVEVYAEVRNTKDQPPLLPGAFVYARIDGPIHTGKTLIPRAAIRDGVVFVIRDVPIADDSADDGAADEDADAGGADSAGGADGENGASEEETTAAEDSASDDAVPKTRSCVFPVAVKTGRTFQSLVEVFTGDTDDELRKDDIIATTNLDVLLQDTEVVYQVERTVEDELLEIRVPLIRLIEN